MEFTAMKVFMNGLVKRGIPGNSIRIYHDGREVFGYSSGLSDIENGIPMRGDELMYIYSCSKVLTVTAALQLYERGLFLLDDPLYDIIPEYREMYIADPAGETVRAENPITLRQLFTMTSGLTYNTNTQAFRTAREKTDGKMDTQTVIRCLASDPLRFEPGSRWEYGLSHDVLAAVVEIVSGKKFRRYVQENIFDPLEMSSSTYDGEACFEKLAQQYAFVNSDETDIVKLQSGVSTAHGGYIKNAGKKNSLVFGSEYDSGGAGVITTVPDYAKFTHALACGGVGLTGERILSPGTIELLRTDQLNAEQLRCFSWNQHRGYGYGLGVRTMTDRAKSGSNGSVGEFGWGGAAGATVIVDPDNRLSAFYSHYMLNPWEDYYQPRLRNVLYSCFGR